MNKKEEYLPLKEAAQMAETAYATVKRDIENGILPAYSIGRKYFIRADDALVYQQRRQALKKIEGYTIRQLMEVIPLSYAFIMELVRSKKLEAVKVGRQYIIPKENFQKFIEQNKIT